MLGIREHGRAHRVEITYMKFHVTMFIGIIAVVAITIFVLHPFLESVDWPPNLKAFALFVSVITMAAALVATAVRAGKSDGDD